MTEVNTKTVFITGASSGIGYATARLFQDKGWNVVATLRKPEQAEALAALPRVLCLPLDVNDRASIHAAVEKAIAHFGAIDVL
ncbi:SDR family NAD(P)-dependent oxidoreductase, partial [Alcanivorax sp. HI0044]